MKRAIDLDYRKTSLANSDGTVEHIPIAEVQREVKVVYVQHRCSHDISRDIEIHRLWARLDDKEIHTDFSVDHGEDTNAKFLAAFEILVEEAGPNYRLASRTA